MARTNTEKKLLAAQPAGTDLDISVLFLDMGIHTIASFQVNGIGLDADDGVLTVKVSNDGVKWKEKLNANITMGTGTTNEMIVVGNIGEKMVAVSWAKGTNTTGTLDCFAVGKGG